MRNTKEKGAISVYLWWSRTGYATDLHVPEQHEEQVEGLNLAHVLLASALGVEGKVRLGALLLLGGDHRAAQANLPDTGQIASYPVSFQNIC